MVIVYTSNTGFTREYAEMLSRVNHMKLCELSQATRQLDRGSPVFYLGPLMAGRITGLKEARRLFDVKGVLGVGMSPPCQEMLQILHQSNETGGAPIFYAQGGWDPSRLSWTKRKMTDMATRSIRRALQDKGPNRTPLEQQQLDFLRYGGTYVSFQNLSAVQEWLKGVL